jgi:hypothetical protein
MQSKRRLHCFRDKEPIATSCRFHGEHWGPAMGLDIGREAMRGGYLYGSAGDFLVVAIRKIKKEK